MNSYIEYALQIARRIATARPGVVAVGVGPKVKDGKSAKRATSIIFYVLDKTDVVPRWEVLPSYIDVGTPVRPRRIRTDVVQAEQDVSVQAWTEASAGGVYTWPMPGGGNRRSLISNHVLGADGVANFEGLEVQVIGRAPKLDAAQVLHGFLSNNPWLDMDQTVAPMPRAPRTSDKKGRVYLPTQRRWKAVDIFDVHSSPPGYGDGFILTEPVTNPGDSGSLLIGQDNSPLGFLLGRWAGRSVFSGLQVSIRALL